MINCERVLQNISRTSSSSSLNLLACLLPFKLASSSVPASELQPTTVLVQCNCVILQSTVADLISITDHANLSIIITESCCRRTSRCLNRQETLCRPYLCAKVITSAAFQSTCSFDELCTQFKTANRKQLTRQSTLSMIIFTDPVMVGRLHWC